jgi:hypothetical protein
VTTTPSPAGRPAQRPAGPFPWNETDVTDQTTSLGEVYHAPDGCHLGGRPHLGPCRDRSAEAGHALTEIRTVLSRAETTLRYLLDNSTDGRNGPAERPRLPKLPTGAGMIDAGEPPYAPGGQPFDDPDHALMVEALRQTISALAPWRRGPGKTKRWVADEGPTQLAKAMPNERYNELYEDEVGDEMFQGHLAVLAELRRRLALNFMLAPNAQRTMLGVIDDFTRDLVEREREDEDDWEEVDRG